MIGSALPSLLEEGSLDFPGASILASAWGAWAARDIARPVPIPPRARVVTVGGSTLGGSGKTALAIALSRAIASQGENVTLVGHAHRAYPKRPRRVTPDDDVREVGDEALVAARALQGSGAAVVVAETRREAVEYAAKLAGTLVIDGPLQTRPQPAFRSLLAVDAAKPWGSGRCPPLGDLRAPREALLSACDYVVALGQEKPPSLGTPFRPVLHLPSGLAPDCLLPDSNPLPLSSLVGTNIGLLLGLARPRRVVEALEELRIRPRCTLRFGDHLIPSASFIENASRMAREHRLDAWLATAKCVTRLPTHVGNVPVVVIRQELEIGASELKFLGLG